MSAARGRTASPWPRVVAGASYVLTMVVLGTVATWPIYRTAWLLVVVAVAAVVGAVIAAAVTRRRLPWWVVVLALLGAVAVLGVPVTMPGRLSALDQLGGGFVELARGVALAWKDLLTVDLPVGDYRNLLVPVFVTFLVATTLALLAAWRADRRAVLAVPAAVAMPVFGLLFGRSVTSDPLVLGPVSVPAPIETFVGVATVVAALLWLAWRERDQRLRLLAAAAGASGIRARRLRTGFSGGRLALAAGMVVVAVVVTAAVVPFAARGLDREVLRSAVGPTIDLAAEPSPLSTYRSLFSDTQADLVLFQVTTTGTAPARVRLATLDVYDGEIYRAGSSGDGRFVRVPSSLDAGAGTAIDATVTIGGLSGIWLPTLGQVSSVDFQGSRAAALSDGFYYNADAQAGVDTVPNGLGAGDVYRVTGVDPITPDLATVRAPGGAATSVTLPDNLTKWVEVHQTGTGGEALSGLVALLRARGYLSHALSVSTGETPVWMAGLADYTFQPSAAGHSLARVDQLFAKLLQREADPQAAATDNYVAAVGDDEQFAVAVALIANKLGFPARVVLGARLSSADATVPVCVDGACRADDLSAWTEVRDDQGQWIAVDATPQHAQSPSLEVTRQRDPENVTEVRPDSVDEVAPPNPVQQDSDRQASSAGDSGWDLAWLWATLKIGGLVLLVLLVLGGPFLLVAGARFFRRRSRRLQADPAQKVAGGWDEYVDAAIDAGRARPASRTRRELAALYGTPSGTVLADGADEAVFSPRPPSAEEADAFWRIVDVERRGFAGGQGFWRKLATALSLRSFVRFAAPRFTRSSTRSGARAGSTGRGTRRTRRPAR